MQRIKCFSNVHFDPHITTIGLTTQEIETFIHYIGNSKSSFQEEKQIVLEILYEQQVVLTEKPRFLELS